MKDQDTKVATRPGECLKRWELGGTETELWTQSGQGGLPEGQLGRGMKRGHSGDGDGVGRC